MNKPSDVSHIDRHIGQRMRQARLAANCSLEAVACEVGISAPLIRYYERGSRRCYASRLYRIARFLGVSVSYFYEGVEERRGNGPRHISEIVPGVMEGIKCTQRS